MNDSIQSSQKIKLESMEDMLRLLASSMGQRAVASHLNYFNHGGKHLFFYTTAIPGWYDLRGLPVTFMVEHSEAPSANFIEYQIARDGNEEGFTFVNTVKQSTTVVQVPIIRLKELPGFLA